MELNLKKHSSHPIRHSVPPSSMDGNVLNEEFAAYQKLLSEGKSSDDALKVLKLRDLPRSGP